MSNEKKIEKILAKYGDRINSLTDLIGDDEPSDLFYFLADKLSYLMDNDPDKVLSKNGVEVRKQVNKIIKSIGNKFLSSDQIIENRNNLKDINNTEPDNGIKLPDEPVIWTPNHGFKDDALATVLSIYRNGYFLFGSLPQFYNTVDGITSWLNGSILINRKNESSRRASLDKCKKAIDLGTDLIIFPEGVWNKTPNLLSLKLWPGAYRIAKEKGIKLVPVIHYKKEPQLMVKDDYIHTVIDEPIDVSNMSEKAALDYLRDVYAYWLYLMMERYGKTTREELMEGYSDSGVLWESKLFERLNTADRYDTEIEVKADYVDKRDIELLQAWKDIAGIKVTDKNKDVVVPMVADAKNKVMELEFNNFQRRF